MKNSPRFLLVAASVGILCTTAFAKPIRSNFMAVRTAGQNFARSPINAMGNQDASIVVLQNFDAVQTAKTVKFPRSGIIIDREKQTNTPNLSGSRQVFRNVGNSFPDPETNNNVTATRDRRIYPKGRARKMNLVTMRLISIFNPKNAR